MSEAALNLNSVVTAWIQALGVLIAAVAFVYSVVRSRRQRALERYEDITSRWIELLRACRQHPDLDIGPLKSRSAGEDEARNERIKAAVFLEFLVVLERAYVLQSLELSPVEIAPDALDDMLRKYVGRENFVETWRRSRGWFDVEFSTFVDTVVEEFENGKSREPPVGRRSHLTPGWSGRPGGAAQP